MPEVAAKLYKISVDVNITIPYVRDDASREVDADVRPSPLKDGTPKVSNGA